MKQFLSFTRKKNPKSESYMPRTQEFILIYFSPGHGDFLADSSKSCAIRQKEKPLSYQQASQFSCRLMVTSKLLSVKLMCEITEFQTSLLWIILFIHGAI